MDRQMNVVIRRGLTAKSWGEGQWPLVRVFWISRAVVVSQLFGKTLKSAHPKMVNFLHLKTYLNKPDFNK